MLLPSLPCPWRHYDVIISGMTSLLLRHAVWFMYESYSLNIFISILLDAVNGTPTHQNWTVKPSRISSSHKHVILSRISDHVTSFEDGWVISDPIMTSSPTDSPKNRIISNCKAHNQLQLKKLNNKTLQNSSWSFQTSLTKQSKPPFIYTRVFRPGLDGRRHFMDGSGRRTMIR